MAALAKEHYRNNNKTTIRAVKQDCLAHSDLSIPLPVRVFVPISRMDPSAPSIPAMSDPVKLAEVFKGIAGYLHEIALMI